MTGNKLNYNKEETVYVPKDDGYYSIRRFDWKRLKRLVSKERQDEINLPVIYSILYSVAASAGVSIIPLYFANNLSNWVTPTYAVVTIASLLVAIVLTVIDNSKKHNKEADLNEIRTEMNEIEQLYSEVKENKSKTFSAFLMDVQINNLWKLNHWGSTSASIIGNKMIFKGTTAPSGTDGSHIDLADIFEISKTYEISCHVKSNPNTTGMFQLWCHDQIGQPNGSTASTRYKVPSIEGETIKLNFKADYNKSIRIHLQYTPGQGQIEVSDIKINQISE